MSHDQRVHVCSIKVKDQGTNLSLKAYNYEYSHNKVY